jgi:competence protein ComEA
MWQELWTEHRKGVLFSIGMLCFLTAGLVTRLLPLHREPSAPPPAKETAFRSPQESSIPAPPAAEQGGETKSPINVLAVRTSEPDRASDAGSSENEWFVYVTGSVRSPGVYKLQAGSRLFHLIEAAGGLNGFADPVAVNMASLLEDGLHVHVPKKGERVSENTTAAESSPTAPPRTRSTKGRVDVNRASQEELTSLKGVGPSLAKKIVEHRGKNGPFRSAEDLLQVKGIGVKKLEGFRDSLTLGP